MKRRDFLKTVGLGIAGAAFAPRSVLGNTAADSAQVLVEAASFEEKGGWVVDPQFMDQMGAPYLLAHGMGVPVKNARARVAFPFAGKYTLWVRTKNWCPGEWEAPGRFKVVVDGVEGPTVFGTEPGWAWQKGGTIDIAKRDVLLELKDLTGFEGRCDALLFTPLDAAFTPPNDVKPLQAWRDQVKGRRASFGGTFDVVVVGGGLAGCAAALAASKEGLRVALVHDRPVFGGNASAEIRVHTEGIDGKGAKLIKGIATAHWPNGSELASGDDATRQKTLDAAGNIRQFVNYRACAAQTRGGRIVSVDARQVESLAIKRFEAPVFIDCTGDGTVGALAGAEFRYGRESRDEFGEGRPEVGDLWSPEKPDNITMGASVLWKSEQRAEAVPFPEVPWAMPVAGAFASTVSGWQWEYAANGKHQIDDAEWIRDHMLRAIYGSFSNAKNRPENANLALKWVGYISGKRESRRLMGDYVYTFADIAEMRYFDDTVAEEKRNVDVHYQEILKHNTRPDFLSVAMFFKTPREYYIPFRSLYSRNIENLMMAGRCFSASHIGLGGPRVMRTCAQMGLATGYAASLCVKHGATPRGVYQKHLAELRGLIG